uniref:Apple domain-containing protein n=1 Tax=Mesocestoides corti TaxID=53468 RepID=A0A5K3EM16_MESCO
MALVVLTSLLLLIFYSAFGMWIKYSGANILRLMSTRSEIKETTLERCFERCTSIGSSFDSGLYDSHSKMCYCGTLSTPYNQKFLIEDPAMTAFTKKNGLDCSCSQKILRNSDEPFLTLTSSDMDECEDWCLEYDTINNVAVFSKASKQCECYRLFAGPFTIALEPIIAMKTTLRAYCFELNETCGKPFVSFWQIYPKQI